MKETRKRLQQEADSISMIHSAEIFALAAVTLLLMTGIMSPTVSGADISWIRQTGTTTEDSATGVGVDNSGNLYVVGWTIGVLPGQSGSGDADAYIIKYSSNGELIWIGQFGTAMGDRASDVAVTGEGNAYVAGTTGGIFPDQTNFGQHDAFIRKYDAT